MYNVFKYICACWIKLVVGVITVYNDCEFDWELY